jgi:hypothetical protein
LGKMLKLLMVIIFCAFTATAFSQSTGDPTLKKISAQNISFGFNYHLQISHLDIAPVLILPVKEKIHAGFGLNYLYHYRNSIREGKSSLGFNFFSRVFITKNIFGHAEYLYSDVAYLNVLVYEYYRIKKADFFIGGGYRQPITDKTDAYLTLLVNLNNSDESPYKNRILFKAGLTF